MTTDKIKLDVFIPGEMIDLCIPTQEFAQKSDWYSWFNDPKINRYLDQGSFPNNADLQVQFLSEQNRKRLILVISNKQEYLGVVSLSELDLVRKKATLAIVANAKKDPKYSPLIALESIARITEHGFSVMGLNKISAGQHENLSGWQQRMELFGFRVEGINRDGFMKGREIADEILIGATFTDYLKIKEMRGAYWDSAEKMQTRINNLPKVKLVDRLYELHESVGEEYYNNLFKL